MKTTEILALILLSCSIKIPTVFSDSLHLLDAWKEININYNIDIQQSNDIYRKIKEEQYALDQLRTIVERHLISKHAELLVNALSSNNIVNSNKNLEEIIDNILNNYDNKMIEMILAQATDELILKRNLPVMPDLLENIFRQNDFKYFEVMLRMQVKLFSSFNRKHHADEKEFLQKYAYRLHKIKNERLFNSVYLNLKSSVQTIVDKLPNNLKYLYFAPYFCLANVKFETYIYAAIEAKVDPLSRYIWLWYDNRSMDDTGYLNAEVTEYNSNNETKFKVAFKSTKYNMFYYMMPSTKMVAGWDTAGSPSNYIWDLEFLDNDRVVFSQNSYLMCGVEQHDNERRNVGGRKKGQVLPSNPECQWRLGQCLFK